MQDAYQSRCNREVGIDCYLMQEKCQVVGLIHNIRKGKMKTVGSLIKIINIIMICINS